MGTDPYFPGTAITIPIPIPLCDHFPNTDPPFVTRSFADVDPPFDTRSFADADPPFDSRSFADPLFLTHHDHAHYCIPSYLPYTYNN